MHPDTQPQRPPLDEAALCRDLVRSGSLWRDVRVVAEIGSTNVDLRAAAMAGVPEGSVLAAELQTAGRGRLDRSWVAAPRAGLTFSVLLRPRVPVASWAWVPLLVGVAVATTLRETASVAAGVKWPNDVLTDGRKLAGVLAERAGDALIVGTGLNVTLREDELPVPGATSLWLEGVTTADRGELLAAMLDGLARRYQKWQDAGGDAEVSGLGAGYRAMCSTIGRPVRVELPGGGELRGDATDVDAYGRLLVRGAGGVTPVSAGNVVHVR